jgi:hypothetical protein
LPTTTVEMPPTVIFGKKPRWKQENRPYFAVHRGGNRKYGHIPQKTAVLAFPTVILPPSTAVLVFATTIFLPPTAVLPFKMTIFTVPTSVLPLKTLIYSQP